MFLRRQLTFALVLVFALAASFGGAHRARGGAAAAGPAARAEADPDAAQGTSVDDDEVLTVDTSLTNVIFSAVDKNKRFVSNLAKEDIRVLEDGVPQEIFTFQKQIDLPFTLALVIDTSGSQEHTLPEEKRAARTFVDSVMRPTKDEVAVVSFTGEVTLEVGLTGNTARVRTAIESVEFVPPSGWVGGGVVVGTPPISGDNQSRAASTSLWDAVWITCDEVLSESSDAHAPRRHPADRRLRHEQPEEATGRR